MCRFGMAANRVDWLEFEQVANLEENDAIIALGSSRTPAIQAWYNASGGIGGGRIAFDHRHAICLGGD